MRLIDADALIADTLKDPVGKLIAEQYNLIGFFEGRPTVEERKTGKWIFYDSDAERYDDIRCSVCGKHFTVDAERWCDIGFIASYLMYCPNCGAKMEE